MLQQSGKEQTAKKAKKAGYQLEAELVELIQNDRLNVKAWDECKESLGDTKQVIDSFSLFSCWHFCWINFLIVIIFKKLIDQFFFPEIRFQSWRTLPMYLLSRNCF